MAATDDGVYQRDDIRTDDASAADDMTAMRWLRRDQSLEQQAVERGCADGRREAYKAAFAAIMAWARDDHDYTPDGTPPPVDYARYGLVIDGIRITTAAIITHGCQPRADGPGADQLALPL